VSDLSHYQYRIKGQRDQKIDNNKYDVHKIQISISNKNKWTDFNDKYFNVLNDYRLVIDEEDTTKSSALTVSGYIRQTTNLENKGFAVIVGVINRYYNSCGNNGYINMEQVVKRELYFTPSTANHYYGCVKFDNLKTWHYRFQGNCVKKVNNTSYDCYKIKHREHDDNNQYKAMDENQSEFNINYQYRIRLIRNGGYIVVERVTKNVLYFGVSISRFWAGAVEINNKHSWHYVDKATDNFQRVGSGNYSVYCVEFKK